MSPAFPGRAPWGTAASLRAWQADALEKYLGSMPQDFLAVATPGAGKTTFALRVATELLASRRVSQIIVVAPTEHLKVQWADAAARVGIQLDPGLGPSKRGRSRQFHGIAVTYAGVAYAPLQLQARTFREPTMVILDEVHHAGDELSWGDAVREAFTGAAHRLALTGTPFRSDANPIPFVRYDRTDDGGLISAPDHTYGYAEALRDHVVRPVLFMSYGGPMRWRTKAGDVLDASLGEPLTKDLTNQAWRTALDPKGEWIPSVLAAADRRLTEVRRHVPDAGGLVISSNQAQARAYARLLHEITGEKPTVVLSDEAGSSAKIDAFSRSEDRWMVAVRMVSEGVDVPRLAVGVFATATSTPLFFAQAIGRFVRTRRRGEVATVFLPTVPVLMSHAALMERQRDHVIKPEGSAADEENMWAEEEALMAEANRRRDTPEQEGNFEALASDAYFDHVLFGTQQFGLAAAPRSREEEEYLGLPGLLEPDQVEHVLRERQRRQMNRARRKEKPEEALHRALATARKELNGLVSAYARTKGVPHSHVHADLRRTCGGPALDTATTEQVRQRIDTIRRWFVGQR